MLEPQIGARLEAPGELVGEAVAEVAGLTEGVLKAGVDEETAQAGVESGPGGGGRGVAAWQTACRQRTSAPARGGAAAIATDD